LVLVVLEKTAVIERDQPALLDGEVKVLEGDRVLVAVHRLDVDPDRLRWQKAAADVRQASRSWRARRSKPA